MEQQLPHSLEAERAVLGAVLVENAVLLELETSLTAEDFSLDSHRRIYSAMVELSAAGHPIDPITMITLLQRRGELETVGGAYYLSQLTDGIPRSPNVKHYVAILREKATLRGIHHAAQAAIAKAFAQEEPARLIIAEFSEQLLALSKEARNAKAAPAPEVMQREMEQLRAAAASDKPLGCTTGLAELDKATTGIRKGELWVVGALPSRGKTAFGVQIAGENVKAGVPTFVFSLEMADTQVGERLLANYSGVDASLIRRPRYMGRDDWERLTESAAQISEWPLWIDDASSLTTRELLQKARLYIRRHKIELVVVDYLMLVQEPGEKERRNKAGKIADVMRRLAKEENVAVVLLSQLSRPKDKDLNSRPSMLDLKESGDIEAAAHTVLLLYMPFEDDNTPTGKEEIIIGKQRNGFMGSIPVTYNRQALRFEDRI